MKNKTLLTCLLLFTLFGCENNHQKEMGHFIAVLSDVVHPSALTANIDYVVVIPNQGCGGCISGAEMFYEENKNAHNVLFVFTNIISQKMLKQKVTIETDNTYLDSNNFMLRAYPQGKSIYPCVLTFRDGRIVNMEFQSPEDDPLSRIIKQ